MLPVTVAKITTDTNAGNKLPASVAGNKYRSPTFLALFFKNSSCYLFINSSRIFFVLFKLIINIFNC